MSNRGMSEDDLVSITNEYLTQRRAVPPPRDLEPSVVQTALARSHSRRFGTLVGVAVVANVSAVVAAGVLYLHISSGGVAPRRDRERGQSLGGQLFERGRLLGRRNCHRARVQADLAGRRLVVGCRTTPCSTASPVCQTMSAGE